MRQNLLGAAVLWSVVALSQGALIADDRFYVRPAVQNPQTAIVLQQLRNANSVTLSSDIRNSRILLGLMLIQSATAIH